VHTPKKTRELKYIMKNHTKGILYGNRCAEIETQKMGFQFLILTKSQCLQKSKSSIFFHNLKVETGLIFAKGPFWKKRLTRKIRECKIKSGDFVG